MSKRTRSLSSRIALGLMGALALGLGALSPVFADIKIGFQAPLTGPAATDAKSAAIAAQMAVDDINAAGGVLGEKIAIVSYDDQAKSDQAIHRQQADRRGRREARRQRQLFGLSPSGFALCDISRSVCSVVERARVGRGWMARMLTLDDVEAGVVGGLFLSAGGSGRNAVEKNRDLGRMALDYGALRLVGTDELDPQDLVITATAVGAPGFANWAIRPRDAINAARRLVERMERPPRAVICGHVPGFNAWLVGAALGLDYVDLASNGRGHPTVKMGGMGLASRPELSIAQVAVSGSRPRQMNSWFALRATSCARRTCCGRPQSSTAD